MRPLLHAIKKDALHPIGLDVRRAALTVLTIVNEVVPRVGSPEAAGVTPDFLANLRLCALATYEADRRAADLSRRLHALSPPYREVVTLRRTLVMAVRTLSTLGQMRDSVLDTLKGGRGCEAVSSHVELLADALLEAMGGRDTGFIMTAAELSEAKAAARSMMQTCADRDLVALLKDEATAERHQSYSLLLCRYGALRKEVAFARWDERDAHEIAPSLFASRGAGRPHPGKRSACNDVPEPRSRRR